MDKQTDRKTILGQAATVLKRAGALTLLATLALSIPSIGDVWSQFSPDKGSQATVAYAESANLANDDNADVEALPEQQEIEDAKINTSELKALIDKAEKYVFANYTEGSFARLTSAIESAEETLVSDEATQKTVDAAVITLQAAINALVEVEESNEIEDIKIDKSKLERDIGKALAYDAAKYKEESFAFLNSAIDFAKYILENENATQEEVETARVTLQNAIDSLIVKKGPVAVDTDRTVLVNLIEQAKGLNAVDYTAGSFADINLAIGVAETLLAKQSVTADEIGAAIGTLQNTIDRLVKVNPGVDTGVDVGVVVPQKGNTSLGNDMTPTSEVNDVDIDEVVGQRLPDTATSTFTILLVGVLGIMFGGLGLIFAKRRKAIS